MVRRNEQIEAPEVLLIGVDGERIGVVPTPDALDRARADGLVLIEVQPTACPPVCRLMNAEELTTREAREVDVEPLEIRTIRFPLGLSETDFRLKTRHGSAFLDQGGAVEIRIPFHTGGRRSGERASARTLLERIQEALLPAGNKPHRTRYEAGELIALFNPRKGECPDVDQR
jgi:translation initiation factor IF-3